MRLEPADCTVVRPTELRADAVVVLRGPGDVDEPVPAVAVEVQLGRDPRTR